MSSFVVSADRLFDATGGSTVFRPRVRVTEDRLAGIDSGLGPTTIEATEEFNFPGCTLLPGLIDTHVHLVFAALETNEAVVEQVGRESYEELITRALQNARAALQAGITTVRDCGGKEQIVQEVRNRISKGEAEGPAILACGMPITTATGHCHWLGLKANTAREVQQAAERMLEEDVDFLKVMATGGNMTAGSDPMRPQYDHSTLRMVAEIGRKAGRHTAAHVLSRSALPGVVAAQIRTIEHCDWRVQENRYEFDAELAKRIIDQGQFVGLTMSGITRRAFLPDLAMNHCGPVSRLDVRFECERRMLDAGVAYNLHSDAGVRLTPIARFDLGLRSAVVELRLTPAEAIIAATATAARAIGLKDRGTVTPGSRADLLIVEGNPLQDLAALKNIKGVMKAGKWLVLAGKENRKSNGPNCSAATQQFIKDGAD